MILSAALLVLKVFTNQISTSMNAIKFTLRKHLISKFIPKQIQFYTPIRTFFTKFNKQETDNSKSQKNQKRNIVGNASVGLALICGVLGYVYYTFDNQFAPQDVLSNPTLRGLHIQNLQIAELINESLNIVKTSLKDNPRLDANKLKISFPPKNILISEQGIMLKFPFPCRYAQVFMVYEADDGDKKVNIMVLGHSLKRRQPKVIEVAVEFNPKIRERIDPFVEGETIYKQKGIINGLVWRILKYPDYPMVVEYPENHPTSIPLIAEKLQLLYEKQTIRLPGKHGSTISCLTCTSFGLYSLGQHEIVVIVQDQSENTQYYVSRISQVYKLVYEFAANKSLVYEGDFTEFGGNLFGNIRGFLYSRHTAFPHGIVLPDVIRKNSIPYIVAIGVTVEELEIAKQYGNTRVLANLGFAYRYFPCPPWIDPLRKSVVDSKFNNSVLKGQLSVRVHDVTARYYTKENKLVVEVSEESNGELTADLGQLDTISKGEFALPFIIPTIFDPNANAHIVWNGSDTNKVNAISPEGSDGSRIGVSFIGFVSSKDKDMEWNMIEDGFILVLSTKNYQKLVGAMKFKKNCTFKSEKQEFLFRYVKPRIKPVRYLNPVDGKVYTANWISNFPERIPTPEKEEKKLCFLSSIRLLSPDEDFKKRSTPTDLVNFITLLNSTVEKYVEEVYKNQNDGSKWDLLLQITVNENDTKVDFKGVNRPKNIGKLIFESILSKLTKNSELAKIKGLNEKGPLNSFIVCFKINGGTNED